MGHQVLERLALQQAVHGHEDGPQLHAGEPGGDHGQTVAAEGHHGAPAVHAELAEGLSGPVGHLVGVGVAQRGLGEHQQGPGPEAGGLALEDGSHPLAGSHPAFPRLGPR